MKSTALPDDDASLTTLQLLHRTSDAWRSMYKACAAAEESIAIEQYIIEDDAVGRGFLELLALKALQGVKVTLLIDTFGSRNVLPSPHLQTIRSCGGRVRFFHPLRWYHVFRPSVWFPRTHCKIMIVDSRIAYVGSACIAECMKGWRDLVVRMEGDDVGIIIRHMPELVTYDRLPLATPSNRFSFVVSRPQKNRWAIYNEILDRIDSAQRSIYLVSPYFFPPFRLRQHLRAAARRGVDVRVMCTATSDNILSDLVLRSYLKRYLHYGWRMFLYVPTVMHSKYMVIDDWAMVGSANLDNLSLLYNREASLVMHDAADIAELRATFLADLGQCLEADAAYIKTMPLWVRLIGRAARVFRRLL